MERPIDGFYWRSHEYSKRDRSLAIIGKLRTIIPYLKTFLFLQVLTCVSLQGVLSKGRADNLRNLPLQECDLLLHEAGAPPIHTPLEELMKLPERVKKRLYVVHSSSIPPDCDLRLAPTGTAGTLRLDRGTTTRTTRMERMDRGGLGRNRRDAPSTTSEEDEIVASTWSGASNEYAAIEENSADEVVGLDTSFRHTIPQNSKKGARRSSIMGVGGHSVPLVSLRAASSTDAWFILNLLSAVPFLSR